MIEYNSLKCLESVEHLKDAIVFAAFFRELRLDSVERHGVMHFCEFVLRK